MLQCHVQTLVSESDTSGVAIVCDNRCGLGQSSVQFVSQHTHGTTRPEQFWIHCCQMVKFANRLGKSGEISGMLVTKWTNCGNRQNLVKFRKQYHSTNRSVIYSRGNKVYTILMMMMVMMMMVVMVVMVMIMMMMMMITLFIHASLDNISWFPRRAWEKFKKKKKLKKKMCTNYKRFVS